MRYSPERGEVRLTTATIAIADEAAMARFATRLVSLLPSSVFIGLSGDLGAGKTTFVKHVAAAEGIDPTDVVSPTFGLIHVHEAPIVTEHSSPAVPAPRIVHADMYRLACVDDLAETGWDDALSPPCHVFVEWPERIAAALPHERIDLSIAIDSPDARTLTLVGRGAGHARIVNAVAALSATTSF